MIVPDDQLASRFEDVCDKLLDAAPEVAPKLIHDFRIKDGWENFRRFVWQVVDAKVGDYNQIFWKTRVNMGYAAYKKLNCAADIQQFWMMFVRLVALHNEITPWEVLARQPPP